MSLEAVKKISISLQHDVAEAAARLAEQQGVSLSTWLSEAAELDASVVLGAGIRGDAIVTSDRRDIDALSSAAGLSLAVVQI